MSFRRCSLLYYAGASWCPQAELCFDYLINRLSRNVAESKNRSLENKQKRDWLLSIRNSRNLYSLKHLAIISARETIGAGLLNKLTSLKADIPWKLIRAIELKDIIGNLIEDFGIIRSACILNSDICLELLLVLLYTMHSNLSLFDTIHHPTAGDISILELFSAFRLHPNFLWIFQQILRKNIKEETEHNTASVKYVLNNALNCAVLRHYNGTAECILQHCEKILSPARSPNRLANADRNLCDGIIRVMRMLPDDSNISPMTVACLSQNYDFLQIVIQSGRDFEISEVSN